MRFFASLFFLMMVMSSSVFAQPVERPNILWIVSEDNNPYLGCYGDPLARTPAIDGLAKQGLLYENCFSAAPVCAPSRFTLITGMYATSCGPANHMRASGKGPPGLRGFAAYLRDAGYHCTNNDKTDYNTPIDLKDTWDESGKKAHWRNRPAGKPFFAVFNHAVTHESQVFPANQKRWGPFDPPTDPAKVRIPAYTPDTPRTRMDRANYHNQIARLDEQVAELLAQLQADGLAENTIIFYYGDNGGVLPRSKRFAYDSGLHVPLIVKFPKKWQHLAPVEMGKRLTAPVSFVDFAPTVLSLAGVKAPAYFQGQAFLGKEKKPDRQYAFSFRDRMDERYDMVRTARDERYRYIRNFKPHLPWGQHVQFMFQQAGVLEWQKMFAAGKLNEVQARFWKEKPAEELYDLKNDPDEVNNLILSAEHQAIGARMRDALQQHMIQSRDCGLIPEGSRFEGYAFAQDRTAYDIERIMAVADLAAGRDVANLPALIGHMGRASEFERYWAVLGCVMLKGKSKDGQAALLKCLMDQSPQIQVEAAHALCWIGQEEKGVAHLQAMLKHENNRVRLQAMNALDRIGAKALPALAAIQAAIRDEDDYVKRAARYTAAILRNEEPPGENDK